MTCRTAARPVGSKAQVPAERHTAHLVRLCQAASANDVADVEPQGDRQQE